MSKPQGANAPETHDELFARVRWFVETGDMTQWEGHDATIDTLRDAVRADMRALLALAEAGRRVEGATEAWMHTYAGPDESGWASAKVKIGHDAEARGCQYCRRVYICKPEGE